MALALSGYGISFAYRSGRYDCLGILLLALIAMVVASPPAGWRLLMLGTLAALLPWTGLQLVVLVCALLAIHFCVYRSITRVHFVIVSGLGLGVLTLLAFLAWKGTLLGFVQSIQVSYRGRGPS